MRGKVIVIGILALASVAVGGTYLWPSGFAAVRQMAAGGKSGPSSSRGTGGAARAVTVVSATASTADFPIRRYAIGYISSPAVVNVSARVASQIVSIAVRDGQTVKAGDLLFSLDDRALQAELAHDNATLAKDQALQVSAEADLKRAADLAAKQAGTQQAYDQAAAAAKAAAATVVADQAAIEADNVQLGFTRITAPIAGRLGAVNAAVGDLVTTANGNGQTTPLVTITQMDPLQVSFSLPEDDLPLVRKALSVPEGAVVTLRHDGEPDPIGTGKLTFVDSSVDTASGTIAVRASVPNPDLKLWPGQYVGATLEAGTMPDMVSVPTVAVQPSQKGPFVYVVKPDDTVEMRPVTVALTAGADSGLSSGLKSGEKVVVEGQTRLKNGAAVSEGGAASGSPGGRPAKVAQKADGEAAR